VAKANLVMQLVYICCGLAVKNVEEGGEPSGVSFFIMGLREVGTGDSWALETACIIGSSLASVLDLGLTCFVFVAAVEEGVSFVEAGSGLTAF